MISKDRGLWILLLVAVFISASAVGALPGNNVASGVRSFTVDNIEPAVSIYGPGNDSYTSDDTPLLNVTSLDNNSDSMWYSIDGGVNETNGCNATSCLVNLTKNWVVGSGGDT